MERLNKIFAEWAKDDKRTELASEKVQLGLIDDIKKDLSNAEKDIKSFIKDREQIIKFTDKAIKNGNAYVTAALKLNDNLQNFEKAAKDLGLNANEQTEFKNAKSFLNKYDVGATKSIIAEYKSLR